MFKTAATKLAHNSTLPVLAGNKDLRPLQDLITAEKAVVSSLQKLSADFDRAAGALRLWGSAEGDALEDILGASTTILGLFSEALSQYTTHELAIRDHMKAIRTREEQLDDLKKQRKGVGSRMESADKKLARMGSEHKGLSAQTDLLSQLKEQMRTLDMEILKAEASLGDFKRTTTREWMSLKFGGLVECSEKGTIVGELGKLLIAEIPLDPTQPGVPRVQFQGQAKVQSLVADAERCVGDIKFSAVSSFNRTPSVQDSALVQTEPPGSPSRLPEIQRGPSAWSTGGTEGESARSAPNFLGTPSGLSGQGLGQFIDPSDALSTQTAFDSSAGAATQSREPSQAYSVDDMGVTTPTNRQGSSIAGAGPWGGSGGGRFATFPVKGGGGGGGVSLGRGAAPVRDARSGAPAAGQSLLNRTSFELDIVNAVREGPRSSELSAPPGYWQGQENIAGPNEQQREGTWRATTFSSNYNQMPSPTYPSSFAPASPSAAVGGNSGHQMQSSTPNPWDNESQDNRQRSDSEASVHLAYAAETDVQREERMSRHVRFSDVSDGSEEMKKREQSQGGYQQEPVPPSVTTPSDPRFQSLRRIPPPLVGGGQQEPLSAEDERARNAAAARDLTPEISYSPPSTSPVTSPFAPAYPSPSITPTAATNSFRQDASPRPSVDTTVPKTVPSDGPPARIATEGPSLVTKSGSNQTSQTMGLPPSPSSTLVLQGRAFADPGLTLGHNRANSSMSKPLSSLNSPSPATPRTIPAAAFKRSQGRNASASGTELGASWSDEGGIAPVADTSPLSLRKRALPTSPYPQRPSHATPGTRDLPEAPEKHPHATTDAPWPPSADATTNTTTTNTSTNDTSSTSQGGAAATTDLPPISSLLGAEDDDDQFDYISAYVNSIGSSGDLDGGVNDQGLR